MSATDELRRLLDEHGVEYRWDNGTATWHMDGVMYNAWGYDNERLTMSVCHLTPEQAIAATLGEANEDECYLMRHGEKFPVELDYGFIGIMPLAISVAGFRYVLEFPYEK